MTTDSPASRADERYAEALAEYQSALDLGLPVERAAFLARFPDLPDLAADLDALDALHQSGDTTDAEPALADFELVREVGRGGMGVVFEARQWSLGRTVAVKVLTRAAALDARARRRFLHEARAAALVEHPNVVPVYHVGEESGVPFYVMPLIAGRSLAAPDVLPPRGSAAFFAALARLGADAARALAAAHDQAVIHRDVKPANLLLDADGKVWVADFGLALVPFADGLTRSGGRPGTPRYMSPEQFAGSRDRIDGRTDVYSLGVTLYELAAGEAAFGAADEVELIRQITQGAPRPIGEAVPRDLETVILKAMARDPDDRYPTARALADDLERFVAGRPVLARRPGVVTHLRKWARRNRRSVVFVAGTLVVAVIAGLAVSAAASDRAYRAERAARVEAERNRELALAAVADLGEASDDILAHAPGMQERQLKYLLRSRDTLAPFADDDTLPVKLRRDIAWVHARLCQAQSEAGLRDQALASARELVPRIEALVALEPDHVKLRLDAANANIQLANCVLASAGTAAAVPAMSAAHSHAQAALRLRPDSATALELTGLTRCRLADFDEWRLGIPGSSLPAYLRTAEDYEELRRRYPEGHPRSYMRLSNHWAAIGLQYGARGEFDAAERAYRTAVGHDDHLATVFRPKEPLDIRAGTMCTRGALGWLIVRRGRIEEGTTHLRRCVAETEEYVRAYKNDVGNRHYLCEYSAYLSLSEHLLGRIEAANEAAARAAALLAEPGPLPSASERARFWASLPAGKHRDPAVGAKALADAGTTLKPDERALVLYRLGRFTDAEAVPDAGTTGELIRTAGLAQRGDRAGAKAALDAASARLAAQTLHEPQVMILQREVSALIGSK